MLMIRPEPRSIMCGSAAWDVKNAPERLTAITLYQSSSVIFSAVLSIVMPALLTRTSSRPCCSITSAIVRRQSSAEPRLPWCTLASRHVPAAPRRALSVPGIAAVAGGDDRLLPGEAAGDRGADPTCAAGDEDDPSGHPGTLDSRSETCPPRSAGPCAASLLLPLWSLGLSNWLLAPSDCSSGSGCKGQISLPGRPSDQADATGPGQTSVSGRPRLAVSRARAASRFPGRRRCRGSRAPASGHWVPSPRGSF